MNKQSIENIKVTGKKVFVRVDFNVPFDENHNITDPKRIEESLPTIKYLLKNNAKIIIGTHLGRPHGVPCDDFSLKHILGYLEKALDHPVIFTGELTGEKVRYAVDNLNNGDILLLENLRFDMKEEENDLTFAKELASYAEIYVNDAFGTAHRAHASTCGMCGFLPSYAGILIDKELKILGAALYEPKHPFTAILGGAKVGDKIGVICNLLKKVDNLIIGGGMAFTFFKAMGYNIGNSLLDENRIDTALKVLDDARKYKVNIILPSDVIIADAFSNDANIKTVDIDKIPDGFMGLDIGPKSCKQFMEVIEESQLVIWNGPMGAFEMSNFSRGTRKVAEAMSKCDGITIIGGGDSDAALEQLGLSEHITHISTGGGAALEFLEGKTLPGVAVLLNK